MRIIFILLSCIALQVQAQYDSLWQRQQQLQRKGMYVLGSWALGNIAVSSLTANGVSGSNKAFHQMNVYWNVVNAGIAGATLLIRSKRLEGNAVVRQQHRIEKIFLFNSGLDIAYITAGAYLQERSRRNNSQQLKGFGESLVLQGAFLLLFDGVMYLLHNQQGRRLGEPARISVGATTHGVGLLVQL
jgi:hypothetical protein